MHSLGVSECSLLHLPVPAHVIACDLVRLYGSLTYTLPPNDVIDKMEAGKRVWA